MEVVRHFSEGLEDLRFFELSKLGTSLPREGHRSRVHLIGAHRLRAPDRSGRMRTFGRLAGRQAAVNTHERQCHVIDHHRPPTLDAMLAEIKNKTRTKVK